MTAIKDYGGITPDLLGHASAASYSTRRARRAVHRAEAELRAPAPLLVEDGLFHESWVGAIGRMPSGAPTREDGESHLDAWKHLLRADPCAYCGERMLPCVYATNGATVDHIVARSLGERYRERWTNFTGACRSCNGSKQSQPMLQWMARRSRQPRFRL